MSAESAKTTVYTVPREEGSITTVEEYVRVLKEDVFEAAKEHGGRAALQKGAVTREVKQRVKTAWRNALQGIISMNTSIEERCASLFGYPLGTLKEAALHTHAPVAIVGLSDAISVRPVFASQIDTRSGYAEILGRPHNQDKMRTATRYGTPAREKWQSLQKTLGDEDIVKMPHSQFIRDVRHPFETIVDDVEKHGSTRDVYKVFEPLEAMGGYLSDRKQLGVIHPEENDGAVVIGDHGRDPRYQQNRNSPEIGVLEIQALAS